MAELRLGGELDELPDQVLAALVRGVRLAGDDDLHRPLLVGQQAGEPLRVAQDQRQALVGRDAPREADGQRLGIEARRRSSPAGGGSRRGRARPRAAARGSRRRAGGGPARRTFHRSSSETSRERRPDASGPRVVRPQRALVELREVAVDPRRAVDAVGDVRRSAPRRPRSPARASRNMPRDTCAVQARHAVGPLRAAQAEDRHVEDLGRRRPAPRRGAGCAPRPGRCAGRPGRSSARSARAGSGRCRPAPGVCVVKTVPARTCSNAADGVEAGVRHQTPHALQQQEAGVALVHVEDVGLEAAAPPARARRRRRAGSPGAGGARCRRRRGGR